VIDQLMDERRAHPATSEERRALTHHRPLPRWSRSRIPIPSPGGTIGMVIVLSLIVVALVGPALVGINPERQQLTARLQPPFLWGGGLDRPFGTDALGRDLLARVVAGARISLIVGVVATAIAGAIGITLGLIAGYSGRLIDRLIAFVVDVQMAVPFVVIAIGVVAVLGNTLVNVIAVLALTGWVGYARIVRLEVMALRRAPFTEAARAVGASPARILVRHLLPNVAGSIIVIGSQQVAAMILYEAALSYLGLGVPSSYITWGRMVADGQTTLMNAWWVSTVPGIAIALTILGLNLLGDWLRDALDPATHRRRA
jgi:peptide/nickel transport system permease protein